MNMANPYDFTRPVREPAMFFGRRAIHQELLSGVQHGASFAIIGGTRIGKTSLLFQVRQVLLEQLKGEQSTVIGPVFLSTHEFPKLSQAAIYRRIVEEFRTTLSMQASNEAWSVGVKLFEQHLPEDEAFGAFRQALDTIFQSQDIDRRIVIMIDEVDELRRYEWSHSFFNNMRHLISQTTAGERIAIIIAGTLAIRSLYEVAGSPFLNVIQGTKTLDLLSRAETEELVGRPTAFSVDSALVGSIFFETGGHPFLTQYLMRHLCDEFRSDLRKATESAVQEIVARYFDERTDFETWVSEFTDTEKRAYHLIASKQAGASRSDLVQAIGDPKQANHAIRLLVHIGVVREERPNSNRYLVGGDMFRRWFYDTFDVASTGTAQHQPASASAATRRMDTPAQPQSVRLIRVFVASPSDVKEERTALEPVVSSINQTLGPRLGGVFDLVNWETDTYPGLSPGGAQAVIDPQIEVETCDLVIGIFWRRFGTPNAIAESGSAYEIEQAYASALRRGKPHVMLYFCERPSNPKSVDEIDQLRKVLEFRNRLEHVGLSSTYENVQQFTDLVRQHLTKFLQDYLERS
jgi:hypothetical protein